MLCNGGRVIKRQNLHEYPIQTTMTTTSLTSRATQTEICIFRFFEIQIFSPNASPPKIIVCLLPYTTTSVSSPTESQRICWLLLLEPRLSQIMASQWFDRLMHRSLFVVAEISIIIISASPAPTSPTLHVSLTSSQNDRVNVLLHARRYNQISYEKLTQEWKEKKKPTKTTGKNTATPQLN